MTATGCQDGPVARPAAPALLRRTAYRWVYLLLGGAIALALGTVLAWPLSVLAGAGLPGWLTGPLLLVVCVLPIGLVGALAAVRAVEGSAVAALVTEQLRSRPGPSTSWSQRWRTGLLLVLHVGAGAVAGVLLVIGLPTAVVLLTGLGDSDPTSVVGLALPTTAASRLGLALALVLLTVVGGTLLGRGMAAAAPRLLAGSTAERLAAAEASVSVLAGRDRLARELHDSVGHSLSLTGIQAGAARRLLTRDPVAAETAIRAAEDAARRAMVDLDHVLGLLREDGPAPTDAAPSPDLRDLGSLLDSSRAAGARVVAVVAGDLAALPAVVSREAFRIVQEGLTNVLRHAPDAACRLEVDATGTDLDLRLVNASAGATRGSSGGGRGLGGVRERVRDLRGSVSSGPDDAGCWQLAVRLPVHARGSRS